MKQRKGERKGREESRERKEQGRIDHCHHRHNTTNHVITTTSSPPRRLTSVITATTFLPYDHHTHHYITITSAGDHSTTIIVMTGDHNREERERERRRRGDLKCFVTPVGVEWGIEMSRIPSFLLSFPSRSRGCSLSAPTPATLGLWTTPIISNDISGVKEREGEDAKVKEHQGDRGNSGGRRVSWMNREGVP